MLSIITTSVYYGLLIYTLSLLFLSLFVMTEICSLNVSQ